LKPTFGLKGQLSLPQVLNRRVGLTDSSLYRVNSFNALSTQLFHFFLFGFRSGFDISDEAIPPY
jgi:hypothetical protein